MILAPPLIDEHRFPGIFAGRSVLVTGGLGFIGSNLVHSLVALGARVTVLDALLPEFGGDPANLRGIEQHVHVDIADMRDEAVVVRHVRAKDFIFHLAGQVSHTGSMQDPWLDMDVNARATVNLVEACRNSNPAARIVFTSTRQVYGRVDHLPVNESHPPCPVDVNGINKLTAERYLVLYHQVYGIWSTILRLSNTYGPRQKIGDARHGVAALFIHRALHGQCLMLYDGRQLRDFNYVDDVVLALLLAASHSQCGGRVFNLGGSRAHSLAEFAAVLSTLCGCPVKTVPFPPHRKSIEIGDYLGDFTRFRRATGWRPRYGLEEGLAHTIAYWSRKSGLRPGQLGRASPEELTAPDPIADGNAAAAEALVQEN